MWGYFLKTVEERLYEPYKGWTVVAVEVHHSHSPSRKPVAGRIVGKQPLAATLPDQLQCSCEAHAFPGPPPACYWAQQRYWTQAVLARCRTLLLGKLCFGTVALPYSSFPPSFSPAQVLGLHQNLKALPVPLPFILCRPFSQQSVYTSNSVLACSIYFSQE